MADDVRQAVDALAAPVVAMFKKRCCRKPKSSQLNWPGDVFTRWHRDALYFVVVMRTPRSRNASRRYASRFVLSVRPTMVRETAERMKGRRMKIFLLFYIYTPYVCMR